MRTKMTLAILALILASCADQPPQPQAAAVTATVPDDSAADSKVVCHDITVTGSHMNKEKVCMTAGQWARQQQTDKTFVRDKGKIPMPGG